MRVPALNDLDLCYLPGHAALRLFREHRLSPVEVLEAQIRRVERVNPLINAFTNTYFDEALEQARRAGAAYSSGATPWPP